MEQDDVGFGHVEHAEGHRRAQAQGHGQCGRLDIDLSTEEGTRRSLALFSLDPTACRLEVSYFCQVSGNRNNGKVSRRKSGTVWIWCRQEDGWSDTD